MNRYRCEWYPRQRLEEMTDAGLDRVGDDIRQLCQDAIRLIEAQAGKPFWEVSADLIAEDVRRGYLKEIEPLKGMLKECPILAQHLLRHFPALEWLKEAATPKPVRPRTKSSYLAEAVARRDATLDAWQDIKEKVERGTADHVERLREFIAYAECAAGAHHLGAVHPLKAHLREQRIDRYARFLARLAKPEIGMASPVQDDPTD